MISKSFVPGTGYKAAKTLTDTERHIVRNKSLGNSAFMRSKGSPAKRAPSSAGRKIWDGIETKRGKLTRVIASRAQTGADHATQGFSNPDGRGGGRVVIHDNADFVHTARHEMAHITPKRNPVRMQERFKEPKTLGREEGRADFLAHGHSTTGQYPGNDHFQSGYNEVQGKMAAAKYRKEKFGKSAGSTSAFGIEH